MAWLCARKEIMDKYLVLKNAADLSSSTISQMQMADYLQHNDLDAHIREISEIYKERCQFMAEMIDREFPKEVTYVMPKGGLFIWLELPKNKDARELLKRAGKRNVAFIPGTSFYPSGSVNNELRLNFSNMSEEKTREGIKILAEVTKEYLKE